MIENIPRISVLVICYKQEDVIRRAMDSLIRQKDYIYEICINDDKSPDGTWDILLEYQRKYPDLVKPVRNDPNLGIFQNIEATWKRPSGDLIYQLSGDDECPDGYFKHVVDYINRNKIDYRNELFCIYSNYKMINANGNSIIYKSSLVTDHDPIKLHVRKLLSNRGACYSKNVLDSFISVSDGRSYKAELLQEYQIHIFSKKSYYLDEVGNIYYAQQGVSSKFSEKDSRDSHIGSYKALVPFLQNQGHPLDKKDIAFIDYMIAYRSKKWRKAIVKYLLSIDLSLGIYGLQLHRIIFVLRNKLLRIRKKNTL